MATNYSTIPASTAPSSSSPLDYFSRAKAIGLAALSYRRPWRELLDPRALSVPNSLSDAPLRLRSNAYYYVVNYAIIIVVIISLSLLLHPTYLLVFVVILAAWLFFYFLRDGSLVLFGRPVGETAVVGALSVVTSIFALLSIEATVYVLSWALVGVVVVAVHAAVKRTDDLVFEVEAVGPGRSSVKVYRRTTGGDEF